MNAFSKETDAMIRNERRRGTKSAGGFALILAILALMLLTMLGLTLATSTSTELQISTNYRWSQQALYNAEAGIEVGKVILRDLATASVPWSNIMPLARPAGTTWTLGAPPAQYPPSNGSPMAPSGIPDTTLDVHGNPVRNWENGGCDARGGRVGYGVILNDVGSPNPQGVMQYRSDVFGVRLNGAFTLWIRRRVLTGADGTYSDRADDEGDRSMVLTAEGVAPFTGGGLSTGYGQANMAVRTLEVTLIGATGGSPCEAYSGQAGAAASGAGFWGCSTMQGGTTGGLAGALGQGARGSGTQTVGGGQQGGAGAGGLEAN
jgi:hypothetical protein